MSHGHSYIRHILSQPCTHESGTDSERVQRVQDIFHLSLITLVPPEAVAQSTVCYSVSLNPSTPPLSVQNRFWNQRDRLKENGYCHGYRFHNKSVSSSLPISTLNTKCTYCTHLITSCLAFSSAVTGVLVWFSGVQVSVDTLGWRPAPQPAPVCSGWLLYQTWSRAAAR